MAYIENVPVPTTADTAFAALVRDAFTLANDTRALGAHPLAQLPMVAAGLVLDEETPTVEERGRALYITLWWAVERMAPDLKLAPPLIGAADGHAAAPIHETHWARYNLLRYLYLQPVASTPDDHLLAAMGIASPEQYYEERSRAFAEASQFLLRQRELREGDEQIRTLALAQVFARLQENKPALHLLGVASVFAHHVPVSTLLAMAEQENVATPEIALHWLLAYRYLHASQDGVVVHLADPLRIYLAKRQPRALQQGRHQTAAQIASKSGDDVAAAYHLIEGGSPQQAAPVLLAAADRAHQRSDEIARLARRFTQGEVARPEWRRLQLLRAEIAEESGQPEEAMTILRELLKGADTPVEQAELYLRMGKMVASSGAGRSAENALAILQMGLDRIADESRTAQRSDDAPAPLRAEILKEMAWLHIQSQNGRAADELLHQALGLLSNNERVVRAEIYDALSTLRRNQNEFADAIEHARAALVLREGLGDSMRLGRSYNSLGILYRITEEPENAIQAYHKALAIFQRLDNAGLVATTLLNIGTAHHFSERLHEAQRWYRRALLLADEAGLSVTEVRAHANLFEALIALGRPDEARLHWRSAWARSQQMGYGGEIEYLQQVAERDPVLMAELHDDTRLRTSASPERDSSEGDDTATEGSNATRTPLAGGVVRAAAASVAHAPLDDLLAAEEIVLRGVNLAQQDAEAQSLPASSAKDDSASEAITPDGTHSPRLQFGAALDASSAQLLSLLDRMESINVATAMEATGVSKATATRKLAQLVEKGLLVRHGMGRATYYTRAHGVPAVVMQGDLAGLQNRLDVVALRFAQEYNLVRARVMGVRYGFRPDGEAEVCYEVRASFTRNPLLDDFFALERALTRATGSRIQLTL